MHMIGVLAPYVAFPCAALEQWRIITKEKQADIIVMDMPLLDTRTKGRDLTGTFIADLVLQILSYVVEAERQNIRRQQTEGIAATKALGIKFGQQEHLLPDDFITWFSCWRHGEITAQELSGYCGLHISTIYRKVKKLGLSL